MKGPCKDASVGGRNLPPSAQRERDMNTWEFHEDGNPNCAACAVSPVSCPCGGLVHTHYDQDIRFLDSRCDAGHDVEFLELPTSIGAQRAS